ncbi:hypothetical protein [Natronomonas sp. EA1]|uniref:hypothetical protein n=1 Tax=Natronomonas sp. EA1 TaxID=3421655 RepID=UPI003EBE5573
MPSRPSRRTLLRALGAGTSTALAGCLTGYRPDTGQNELPPGPENPPMNASHHVAIESRDALPDFPVVPEIEVVEPYAMPEHPPVLRATVRNPTDEPVTIGEYRAVVFMYAHAKDRAILLPHSERVVNGTPTPTGREYPVVGDGCWRLTDHVPVTAEYGTVEVPAGGRVSALVGLYGAPEQSACLPTGNTRFTASYSIAPLTDGKRQSGRWGFALRVRRLD